MGKVFLKAFLWFLGINVIGAVVGFVFPPLGIVAFLASIIVPIVIIAKGSENTLPKVSPTQHGTPTFSWQGFDVYRDQGFFTFRGRRHELSDVHKVSYETAAQQGCFGGKHYTVHVHLKDMQTPRLSIGIGNVGTGGNRSVEENYERLQIAMGFHG